MGTPLRFIHISDTHFGPRADFDFYGRSPHQDVERLLDAIEALPIKPDFVIHTGDVVSSQNAAAYKLADSVLSRVTCPMYFTTGNHDDPTILNTLKSFAPRKRLIERPDVVCYSFELMGTLFIGLDAKNPDNENPSGILPPDQLAKLKEVLSGSKNNFIVFTHFPALKLDSPWIDANLLITNGEELHSILKSYSSRCLGVFFGHIHQPVQIFSDGIRYESVPSATFQFAGLPNDIETLSHNLNGLPGMNLVTVDGSQVIVKNLSIP